MCPRGACAIAVVVAIAATASWLAPDRASAQSLADAAKSAEEQRQASGQAVAVLTNGSLLGANGYDGIMGDYRLAPNFERYQSFRTLLIQERARSRPLDRALVKQEAEATGLFDMEDVYRRDADVMRLLNFSGVNAHAYVMADVAFNRAMQDAKLPKADQAKLSPARAANLAFVEEHYRGHNFMSFVHQQEKDLEFSRRIRP